MSSTFDIRRKLYSIDAWLAFQYSITGYTPVTFESTYFPKHFPDRSVVQKVQRIAIKKGLKVFDGYPWSQEKADRFAFLMKKGWEVVGFVSVGQTWYDGTAWIWWDGDCLWNDDGKCGALTAVQSDDYVGFEIDYETANMMELELD
ncbi:hypothetical protein BJ508DRAFT_365989 [Ascobolus immersus RN42]|uniref:Uncharacterized protein n=1 Tax=Ascobolus immersus RN42 TaxID=1160509 RepID=A0A3N4HNM0_ASCIM|nr:hypothetical protein BJ508DRAFT_365989 [Ascobolus immersus RN42]